MGQRIEFASNAHTCQGYLAAPASGKGPAVVVIQEWWGLVPHIEDVVNRFAAEGFVALAPDLYHGKTTKSPDEAGKLVMEMDAERAEREIAAAGEYLLSRPECSSKTYGVVGFCMGGGLAQYTATKEDGKVGAAVSFYGGFKSVPFDWDNLTAPLLQICGEKDEQVTKTMRERDQMLRGKGKTVDLVVYPDAPHAFFNDDRPEVYKPDAAKDAWKRTLEWFRTNLR
jgi:carboxymethylenebutenolidase